ncbi:MAG: 30S ribosomal protein S4 [Phycisphaerales bacterium]|nr:30S ribosomal protein S4 [Phycisphaerales bacterium]
MSRYLGPKVRLSRRLGVAIVDLPKHTKFGTEFTAPGMHGFRKGRLSEYGIRLREKQRLKAHYSVLEKQFRRYMATAKKAKGNTAVTLQQLLETRLDNVVRRLGVVRSIWAARQLVAHGLVKVNGKKVDIASFQVAPGMTITFKEKIHKILRENMEGLAGHQLPTWMEFNPAAMEARCVALPMPEQIPFEINPNLIIEFYR